MRSLRSLVCSLALVFTALLALGCGSVEVPIATAVVRDSAGIQIVENPRISSGTPIWTLSEAPTVEIGAVAGEPSGHFNVVAGGGVLDDGRIVIGDRGSREIRFYDPEGHHLATVGGAGQGPGEFTILRWIGVLPGDTVVGSDWPVGTLSWFDDQGVFADRVQLGVFRPGLVSGLLPDRTLLVDLYPGRSYGNELESWAASPASGRYRNLGHLGRVSRDGERIDTLLPIVGEEWYKEGTFRQDMVIRPMPFARTTKITWNDELVFVGETGSPEVKVMDYSGTLLRLIRWDPTLVGVAGSDRRQFEDEVMASLRRPTREGNFRRWLAVVPYPDVKPVFQNLATDRTGLLWVRQSASAQDSDLSWLVFSPTGELVSQVFVPIGVTVLDLGLDYLLGVWLDDLGVEYVRMYDLRRQT